MASVRVTQMKDGHCAAQQRENISKGKKQSTADGGSRKRNRKSIGNLMAIHWGDKP